MESSFQSLVLCDGCRHRRHNKIYAVSFARQLPGLDPSLLMEPEFGVWSEGPHGYTRHKGLDQDEFKG